MKINKFLIIPVLILILILASGQLLSAQNTEIPQVDNSIWSSIETSDWILILFAFVLLLIIFILANTLHLAMVSHHANRDKTQDGKGKFGKVLMILLLIIGSSLSAHASTPGLPEWASAARLVLYFVIAVELVAIIAIVNWIKYFTGIQEYNAQQRLLKPESEWTLAKVWARINKLRPMEEEASLDIGHSYDGIKELDNATPPWFTYTFLASILIAGIYMYRYHVAYSAPNQFEEYKMEVAEARIAQQEYLSQQGDLVDETNVKLLDAGGIASGKALFASNCVACHGAEGQGGVGPNLTDDYWLHGGNIKDVFKTVKYGVVEKGMKAWQEDFSANQIAQLSSFVKTLRGTNPPGGKEKQGDLYNIKMDNELVSVEKADSSTKN